MPSSPLKTYALRLRPGDDLRQQLLAFTRKHNIRAGAMVTCVGSLTVATLRLANQEGPTEYRGHFEIVSLVGTLSTAGAHLHPAAAEAEAVLPHRAAAVARRPHVRHRPDRPQNGRATARRRSAPAPLPARPA